MHPLKVRFAPTLRWREQDSNPRSPVRRIYANTKIAADREHRGRRSAGKWRLGKAP
jgi:hypothetical protein